MGKIMQLAALSNGKNDYFVMLQSCRCIKHYFFCFVLLFFFFFLCGIVCLTHFNF